MFYFRPNNNKTMAIMDNEETMTANKAVAVAVAVEVATGFVFSHF